MISIALDGPSGSGKGVLADGLAAKLNLIHLDTGAIFRGIACAFLEVGLTDPNEDEIKDLVSNIDVKVIYENDKQGILLNQKNISSMLREETVSKLASKVSAFAPAREKYLEIVRNFVKNNSCIIDGRDITSIVLPNADCKFYLTAKEEIRAMRRYEENISKNIECSYNEVLENLRERDYRDSHREIAPLTIVPDAFVVDNSNMNISETIDHCYNIIVNKLKNEGKM